MKKNYFILLLITTGIVSIANAQQTIYSDDFETGYTADSEIQTTVTSWQTAGANFTFPAKNVASDGAAVFQLVCKNGKRWHYKLRLYRKSLYFNCRRNL